MSLLTDHWRLLTGTIHPHDELAFSTTRHTFNLDYPPPAFMGDVDNAPVILLMANGGYDAVKTPAEFPDDESVQRYLSQLHRPRAVSPRTISPYYDAGNYGDLIENGKLALVNAVAYRSPKISNEPENRALAKRLPSTQVHRRWLRDELIPQAFAGERVVVVHRNRLWALSQDESRHSNIIFSRAPVSRFLSREIVERIKAVVI